MSSVRSANEAARLSVRNVGGIDDTSVTFSPGVTILSGRNATNRTSLLQAIMATLGSDDVSLKGDAEEGRVELEFENETYSRSLQRAGDGLVTSGDPYLDDPELADLFAFLLESNEARRAVERGEDLRELIMRPVDTEAVQAEIQQLETEKRRLDDRLQELSDLEGRLPDLEGERRDLERQIEETRDELAAAEEEIEAFDADVAGVSEEQSELEARLDDLREARSELENVRFNVETERKSLQALEEERADLEDELGNLDLETDGELDRLEADLGDVRGRVQDLQSTISELQTVIQFNEQMLEGTRDEIATALKEDDDETSPASKLTDESVVCWTCGSDIERTQIEETLERLRDLRTRKLEERNELKSRIEDLKSEREAMAERQREGERLRRRLRENEAEIEQREETIERLREEQATLETRIEDLEREVESLEREDHEELLGLHREANHLEFSLTRLQNDLEDVEAEIEDVENRLDERQELETRRDSVREELRGLRTRIDQIEQEAVEQFNEHMDQLLDLLDYENLDRIWIERTEQEVTEGRRRTTRRTFDLHVIRRAESGSAYEDTVDHLSESEREVTGLVFALSGYLVHDVHETVPFMLLDSLEAIDSERIATLVEYLADHATYLVVALLPEDAAALDGAHERITEI